ncbi:MAG: RsmE family RNA methyltransferase [Pseudomonadota bacterium]
MTERSIRLHVDAPLAPSAVVTLTTGQAHYTTRVMRCRDGDVVRLFNAAAGEWAAVLRVGKRTAEAHVTERVRAPRDEAGSILAMASIKRSRLEWAIEKGTEMGMSAFQPLATERTVADRVNLERLKAIAVEAAEQSGRLTLPKLFEILSLPEWLARRAAARPLYVALERASAPTIVEVAAEAGPGDLLIGPEGGFGPRDRAVLDRDQSVLFVSLGTLILRSETAAIAGLAGLVLAGRR